MRHAVLVVCMVVVAVPALAQVSLETELTYEVMKEEWDGILMHSLELTEAEQAAFEPVYAEYTQASDNLRAQTEGLINEFVAAKGELSDDQAETLLRSWLAIQKQRVRIMDKYADKFQKVLPVNKVVRFFQVENKLRTLFMAQLAKDVPLIR